MAAHGAPCDVNDFQRWDGKDALCLSVMFPNDFLLKRFRQRYPHKTYILLFLKPDILWQKPCEFYNYNAASRSARLTQQHCQTPLAAFQSMFADEVITVRQGVSGCFTRLAGAKAFLPTVSQAEVLAFGAVEPRYITDIVCENANVVGILKKIVELRLKADCALRQFPPLAITVSHSPAYFGARDSVQWNIIS